MNWAEVIRHPSSSSSVNLFKYSSSYPKWLDELFGCKLIRPEAWTLCSTKFVQDILSGNQIHIWLPKHHDSPFVNISKDTTWPMQWPPYCKKSICVHYSVIFGSKMKCKIVYFLSRNFNIDLDVTFALDHTDTSYSQYSAILFQIWHMSS